MVIYLHKIQGLRLEERIIDFNLQKQKFFGPGQMYAVLSSVKTYDNLCNLRKF